MWIGVEAVRAAMRAYDGRGRSTVLAETVPTRPARRGGGTAGRLAGRRAARGPGTAGQAIIKKVYARPPSAIGLVAPLVSSAAEEGDPVAREIIAKRPGACCATWTPCVPP